MAVSIRDMLDSMGTGASQTQQAPQQAQQKKPGDKKLSIQVPSPQPFDGTIRSKFVTTQDMAELFNGLLKNVFFDYYGCVVTTPEMVPTQKLAYPSTSGGGNNTALSLIVYFTDKGEAPDGMYKAITQPFEDKSNIVSKMNVITNNNRGRKYILTDEAKELLSDFVEDSRVGRNGGVDWNAISAEVVETSGVGNMFNGHRVCVSVRLDPLKFIKEIYKTRIDDRFMDYSISLIKPLATTAFVPQGAPVNWIVQILQLDNKEVEMLATKVGIVGGQSSLHMVKA